MKATLVRLSGRISRSKACCTSSHDRSAGSSIGRASLPGRAYRTRTFPARVGLHRLPYLVNISSRPVAGISTDSTFSAGRDFREQEPGGLVAGIFEHAFGGARLDDLAFAEDMDGV